MAQSDILSQRRWLDKLDEFIQHWTDANSSLAPGSLVLSGGYALANLVADRAALALALDDVVGRHNVWTVAIENRNLRQRSVATRFKQFGQAVRAYLGGTRYEDAIPRTPRPSDPDGRWRVAMQSLRDLWTTINLNTPPVPGFTPPLTLAGGYSVLLFQGEQSQVNTAMDDVGKARQPLRIARTARDDQFAAIYARLKQYRLAVQALFPPDSPVLLALPRLWNPRKRVRRALEVVDPPANPDDEP
ncbi:MAG: hypothetical protein HONBIEJF_01488 [Fimbriimonadaceae bacterium]|nr:hypothetical protein [Fimbriimonadaceae bacterium]